MRLVKPHPPFQAPRLSFDTTLMDKLALLQLAILFVFRELGRDLSSSKFSIELIGKSCLTGEIKLLCIEQSQL